MKAHLLILMLASAFLHSTAVAEDVNGSKPATGTVTPIPEEPYAIRRYKEFLKSPIANGEQMAKILHTIEISKNINPFQLAYKLQNGLPDAVIVGFVASVTYQDPETKKDT